MQILVYFLALYFFQKCAFASWSVYREWEKFYGGAYFCKDILHSIRLILFRKLSPGLTTNPSANETYLAVSSKGRGRWNSEAKGRRQIGKLLVGYLNNVLLVPINAK